MILSAIVASTLSYADRIAHRRCQSCVDEGIGISCTGPDSIIYGRAGGPGRGEAIASHYVEKTYTSTDVLLCDPHTTDVLDVLYHCSLRSDKCVAVLCTYNT